MKSGSEVSLNELISLANLFDLDLLDGEHDPLLTGMIEYRVTAEDQPLHLLVGGILCQATLLLLGQALKLSLGRVLQ